MKPPISALKLIKPAGTVVSHLAEHTDSGVRGNKEAVFGTLGEQQQFYQSKRTAQTTLSGIFYYYVYA